MKLTRRGIGWALAALLGIAVTAVLTWSVSQLTGQRIGLSSAPLSVVRGLAPPPPAPIEPSSDRDRPHGISTTGPGGSGTTGTGGTTGTTTTAAPRRGGGRDDAGDSGGAARAGGHSSRDD